MKTIFSKTAPAGSRSKVSLLALMALAASFAVAPSARADSYAFNFSGNGINTSGVIDVSATTSAGAYAVTGISGWFSDTNAGFSGAITGLQFAPPPTRTPGSTYFSAPAFTDAAFSYDNLFYPDGMSPAVCIDAPMFSGGVFDIYGMAFNIAGGYEADIWSQGALGGDMVGDSLNGVKLGNSNPGIAVVGSTSAVPEPGTVFLLATGLLGLGIVLTRRHSGFMASNV